MEVGVEVYSENAMSGERKHTTTAYVTFVAVDEHTRVPQFVPPLIVKTAGERRGDRGAAERRETRLGVRCWTGLGKRKKEIRARGKHSLKGALAHPFGGSPSLID